MKVLLVILHAQSARGGAEGYCLHLARLLRERGHDVRVGSASFTDEVDPVHRVPLLQRRRMTRLGIYKAFLDQLDAHLRANQYDIVHAMLPVRRCDVYHPQAGVESISLPRASLAQRLTNQRRKLFARVERGLIESGRPPTVLCMSNASRDETAATFRVDPAKLVTLYNGVDDQRFDVSKYPVESFATPRFILVGQDFERKGVDIAIRALAQLEKGTLDVVGKDDPRAYTSLARRFAIESRVRFIGPTGDVPAALAGAAGLLLPARFEPFGMVVPEAMLMGVPPIVSRVAGASEIVRDGVDGRVVESLEPDEWAGAMRDVITRHAAMRDACLARRSELSYPSHLDQLLAIYDRIQNREVD